MIVTSLYGTYSIVNCGKDQDQLLVRAKSKEELTRIFDGKRVLKSEGSEYEFYLSMCKQEFANALIMMVKDIDYGDFEQITSNSNISPNNVMA